MNGCLSGELCAPGWIGAHRRGATFQEEPLLLYWGPLQERQARETWSHVKRSGCRGRRDDGLTQHAEPRPQFLLRAEGPRGGSHQRSVSQGSCESAWD
ncbi:hypothetical protein NDU88_000161 [Pleurodeles waltl]|uniref:Uncharacterized protein n=1 Tax=Pleurodeles waltl TaxID=8319 RepID=A0AAV7SWE7_PLEWA|nr:hypothetical protein NDU88_000161 [Pleurodeles waltl]